MQNFIYKLKLYNSRFQPLTFISLTNNIKEELIIPNDTSFIILSKELLEKNKKTLVNPIICCFIIEGKNKLEYEKEFDYYYLISEKNNERYSISNKYIVFKNKEEIENYIRALIEIFNNINSNNITEKQLGKKLQLNNYRIKTPSFYKQIK